MQPTQISPYVHGRLVRFEGPKHLERDGADEKYRNGCSVKERIDLSDRVLNGAQGRYMVPFQGPKYTTDINDISELTPTGF